MNLAILDQAAALLQKNRFPVRYPGSAVEIGSDAVVAVVCRKERGGARLNGYGIAPLPPAEIHPHAGPVRGPELEALRQGIGAAVRTAGLKAGKASLVLPDSAARVWLLQLPEIPRAPSALLEMIRWKVKRSVPFRIEDATITHQVLSRPSNGRQGVVLTGLLPRVVVEQYEALLAEQGLKIGLVDMASFNLYNLLRPRIAADAPGGSDVAVLHATSGYFTLMIFRGPELLFYRCKTHPPGEGSTPEEKNRTFRRELAASLSYYTEKLKGTVLARSYGLIADSELAEAEAILAELGIPPMAGLQPDSWIRASQPLDEGAALRLMPAIGAAIGRTA